MTRRILGAVLIGALFFLAPFMASATPRMSLMAGSPCSACHLNGQGGGGRNEIGWGSMALVGAVTYDQLGIDSLAELESNAIKLGEEEDIYVYLGLNARLQIVRANPTAVANEENTEFVDAQQGEYRYIPMQLQPYIGVVPNEWLTLYASYNPSPDTFRSGECNPTIEGMACFKGLVKVQPSYEAPVLRAGRLRPIIGVNYDDHSMLVWTGANSPTDPIIPPNYAENGGDISYQPVYWFESGVGVYDAANLSRSIGDAAVVNEDDLSGVGRLVLSPRFDDFGLTSWLGASVMFAGAFRLENYFLGLGKLGRAALMLDLSRTDRGEEADYTTLNYSALLSVQTWEWLIAHARIERATTEVAGEQSAAVNSIVAGFEFFPIPYLELRPEYRYRVEDRFATGQYTLQVHLWF